MGQKIFETETEDFVRRELKKNNYYDDSDIIVEEKHSKNPAIEKLLKNASKTGGSGKGQPEFIIQNEKEPNFLIVKELKADIKKHESDNRDEYSDYAVDGVLNYAAYLSKEYDVIAVAISGNETNHKISTFIWPRNSKEYKELKDENENEIKKIVSFEDYTHYAKYDHEYKKIKKSELFDFSKKLHNYMRDRTKLTEAEKPLLVSGVLLALDNYSFRKTYKELAINKLSKKLYDAIKEAIEDAVIPHVKKEHMITEYLFIQKHQDLVKKKNEEIPLLKIINDIEKNVKPFNDGFHDVDTVGEFYKEFLRYTGGDKKGLGIVLTPHHITELFAEIATLTKNNVVIDICGGTMGFLISAMHRMFRNATTDEIKKIQEEQLIGVEEQMRMFTLGASNMMLRGDGKANLFRGDCFDKEITNKIKGKANVGLMNPPYSQKEDDLHELNYVKHLLDILDVNGVGVVIVPMSCALEKNPLKKEILEKHTLESVLSMPDQLFYGTSNVVTCIMIFTAHKPHATDHKTWFGYCKDDGFELLRHKGRNDWNNKWQNIKKYWLDGYRNKKVIPGFSILKNVDEDDEWCAEAYMETDYSDIKPDAFVKEIKKYLLFKKLSESS